MFFDVEVMKRSVEGNFCIKIHHVGFCGGQIRFLMDRSFFGQKRLIKSETVNMINSGRLVWTSHMKCSSR